ncbi:hypothetical protein ABMA28_001771 [Loxostege sticticalis]|uniref:Envelope fusion protein n=1 Tax=Loxostege sticticalis TaxID=481309 RepID=A0ABD0T2U9_LOXSC
MSSQGTTQEITLESLDDGPGLLPFRLGATRLTTHYHSFVQYVDIKDIDSKIYLLQDQLLDFKHRLSNDTYVLYELQIEYLSTKLLKVIDHLGTLKLRRSKRGLVDGLGSIIKSITGNLDNTDAVKNDNAIKILQKSNNEIVQEFNSHISLSKEWMVQHSNVIDKLVENQIKINETLELILNSEAHKESSLLRYAKFAQHLVIITENIDDVFEELVRIENILAFIHASSSHHSMISIDVLDKMVQRLISIYGREQVLELELREYYDIIKPGYFYSDNKIVIIFKIPIFSRDRFDLYKLSMAPNRNKQVLVPPFPLIATNRKGYVYIEAECPKYNNWYLCGEKMDHQLSRTPDCIQNLIINQYIDKSCESATVSLSRTAMEELDEKHYVISFSNSTRIHTLCGKEDYDVLNGTYLASIPVNCFLYTPEFTITNTNDQVEGQPLKIMKPTYDIKSLPGEKSHIHLNSVDLRRLHEVQQKVITQPALKLDQAPLESAIYHTTIPLYIIVLSTLVLILFLLVKHFKTFQCKSERLPPKDTTYQEVEEPATQRQHATLFSQLKVQK